MSPTVCVGACSLARSRAGAYLWMFLNWALGLRARGCRVVWLTTHPDDGPDGEVETGLRGLRDVLARHGLDSVVAVCPRSGSGPAAAPSGTPGLDVAAEADLFINLAYHQPGVVNRFRRTALVDIDPGLTQLWLSRGHLTVAPHDVYFTYGETVGASARIPGCGRTWVYTPPPVHLPEWPVAPAPPRAAYTTVSNWWGEPVDVGERITIDGRTVDNSKRASFLRHIDVPARTTATIELALSLTDAPVDAADRERLEAGGWRVRSAQDVCRTPDTFRNYVQSSRGEFSCMKPGYTLLETAWSSERTIGYLASGKPAVVQNTGPSRYLPDDEGLLRFRDTDEAARRLAAVEADYDRHCRAARAVAEEYFDAAKVIPRVLERAID